MLQPLILMAAFRHDLQGVDVEEALAVQGHARQHRVVQGLLHHVSIAAVGAHLQHPPGEEHQADGRAGLGVGSIVGQIVGEGEGLPVHGGTHAAGDVALLLHGALPQPLAGRLQAFVPGEPRHVRHAGIQVHGPHRMALGLLLLPHRLIRLIIGVLLRLLLLGFFTPGHTAGVVLPGEVMRQGAPGVNEIPGQLPVLLAAGDLAQAEQRHFGDLMAGIAVALALLRAEAVRHAVGVAAGHLQQLILAGGLVVGHRRLRQMAQAVQLMVILQVGKGLVHPVKDVVGVQVAVGHLGLGNHIYSLVHHLLQLFVRMLGQGIGHRLDPLVEVRILEYKAVKAVRIRLLALLRQNLKPPGRDGRRGHVGLPDAGDQARRSTEIVHAPAGLRVGNAVVERIPLVGNNLPAHQLHLPLPERIRHRHIRDRHGRGKPFLFHLIVLLLHSHAGEIRRPPRFPCPARPFSLTEMEKGRFPALAAGAAAPAMRTFYWKYSFTSALSLYCLRTWRITEPSASSVSPVIWYLVRVRSRVCL